MSIVYRKNPGFRYDPSGTAAGRIFNKLGRGAGENVGTAFMAARCSDFKKMGAFDVNAPSKVGHRRRWNITITPERC
jgi:hypothetical protein